MIINNKIKNRLQFVHTNKNHYIDFNINKSADNTFIYLKLSVKPCPPKF